jgi:lysophospholipase L1-like esterase
MKITKYLLLLTIGVFQLSSCWIGQSQPFYGEIKEFKKQDQKSFPPKNAILFTGSSSIKKWSDINAYFPGFTIINRGFGGSGLKDLLAYTDDIIVPYHPKQIFIYSGDNDIATGKVTSTEVLQMFMDVFNKIREKLPDANIVYISIKPSPSREKYMPMMEESNIMIRQFLSGYPETSYVDVYHPMLGADGKPKPEIFESDSLHMNAKGYAIWKEAIQPYLVRQ